MKTVTLVNIERKLTDAQVYIQSFCEAWIRADGNYTEPGTAPRNKIVRMLLKTIAKTGMAWKKKGRSYLICSRGGHLLKSSLPFNFRGEIIPMLWDCWPNTWRTLERDLRLLGVKVCFMTASDVVSHFSALMPDIRFVHIPEGVDLNDYSAGTELKERSIDIYEIGRKYQDYHQQLIAEGIGDRHNFIFLDRQADGRSFVFQKFSDFTAALRNSKINIAFPASITRPMSPPIETMTMRYWEGVLSRCMIVGHCPREFSELMGYNPVIEADMDSPAAQLDEILANIDRFQPLVDKNYARALEVASWDCRIPVIMDTLKCLGYQCCPG